MHAPIHTQWPTSVSILFYFMLFSLSWVRCKSQQINKIQKTTQQYTNRHTDTHIHACFEFGRVKTHNQTRARTHSCDHFHGIKINSTNRMYTIDLETSLTFKIHNSICRWLAYLCLFARVCVCVCWWHYVCYSLRSLQLPLLLALLVYLWAHAYLLHRSTP